MESNVVGNQTDRPKINKEYYKIITRKISGVNRKILNSELTEEPLQKLEKEALRGSQTDRPEAKPITRLKKPPDLLTLILKSEHKLNTENCIVKLPKMPFGKHLDYNQNKDFLIRHFFRKNQPKELQKGDDFAEVTKKFRLQEKQKVSQKCALNFMLTL